MSNVHNLKPFQKGVSGNPAGRPRKIPEIDNLLAEVLSDDTDGVSIAEQILRSVARQAIAGNLHAAEIILNRAYGKPKPAVQDDGKDITVRIVRESDYSDDELLQIIQQEQAESSQPVNVKIEREQSMVFGGKTIYF